NDTLRDTVYRNVCAGASFDTNGQSFYMPGMHTQHLRNPDSCYHNLVIGLTVRDTIRDTIYREVCAGRSFDTNQQSYYFAGVYTQHLRQADRCFNNLVIVLSVRDTIRDTIYREVCAGRSFDTNRQSYYFAGVYTQHLRQPDGCYNNLVIRLTVRDTIRDTIQRSICAGGSYDTNGQSYFFTGVYTQHLRQPDGCYNNLVIRLTVRDTIRDTIHPSICAGGSFDTNGHMGCVPVSGIPYQPYYNTGVYTQHLRDTNSMCFRNLVIDLFVRDTIRDTIHREVCSGHTWDTNGITYYNTGYYTQRFRDPVTMCFYNLVIHLIVADPVRTHIYDTICKGDSYYFNGSTYSTAGIYRYNLWTYEGCDSTVVLHLRVLDTALTRIYDTTYNDSYSFMDSVYYQSGAYYHRVSRGANGCDSSVVLNILFCDSVITELYDTVCNDSTYLFNGRLLTTSGIYVHNTRTRLGCDSIVVLNLTLVDYPLLTISDSGIYCKGGEAVLKANTNGNIVTWSSDPQDPTLIGQEHNATIYVSPNEYTIYTVMVDSVPRFRSCPTTESVVMNKPSMVIARMAVDPEILEVSNLHARFTDLSRGDVVYRQWQLAETDPMVANRTIENDSIVLYSPSAQSDSLKVRLIVANVDGCVDSVDRIIPIQRGELWVPNVFTPGGDINNRFRVGASNVLEYEITIYNRGGLMVFHSNDVDESWDGTHKGKPCVEGSYVYVIVYKTKSNSKKPMKKVGSVLLLR
ncbi:MAG: gliding motility-associated C-terminal domain-containing protein, partial [Bacteroidales bacterium]|nr:gliding motility-associated C-terminal domain-containing protein [Bacteroidales bacterium]